MFFKKELTEQTVQITGMQCAHCENAVKAELKKIKGVKDVSADHASGSAVIKSSGPIDREQIAAAVKNAGFALA
ncbi:MAG: heavy-metal-associated domain-containing protein [Treponema sp.]|nr:heavy-metal-associated domain-containing protein [Treponema sp.]